MMFFVFEDMAEGGPIACFNRPDYKFRMFRQSVFYNKKLFNSYALIQKG